MDQLTKIIISFCFIYGTFLSSSRIFLFKRRNFGEIKLIWADKQFNLFSLLFARLKFMKQSLVRKIIAYNFLKL